MTRPTGTNEVEMRAIAYRTAWLKANYTAEYMAASAALVVILIAAFILGSALQIGALGPQPVQVHVPH